jgi:hypothetical protein
VFQLHSERSLLLELELFPSCMRTNDSGSATVPDRPAGAVKSWSGLNVYSASWQGDGIPKEATRRLELACPPPGTWNWELAALRRSGGHSRAFKKKSIRKGTVMGWMITVVLGIALGTVSLAHGVARIGYDAAQAQASECDAKRPGARS